MKTPKTLQQAIIYFADYDHCRQFLIGLRWDDGKVRCPRCNSDHVTYLESARLYKCYGKHEKAKFSLKVGTIFEDSAIGLEKWLPAMWLIVNAKNGISSMEISRSLGVTQKSAWHMAHRIRFALKSGSFSKFGGGGEPVEVDETFIGGKVKNMHRRKVAEKGLRPGKGAGKAVVMGMLDRESRQVRAMVIPEVRRETLQAEILNAVQKGGIVYTDGSHAYKNLATQDYIHETVDHINEYVRGQVHTQGIESFWSMLKRGLIGTYIAVEPFHLDRYVDEQVFRFNNRATRDNPLTDADRFTLACSKVVGKRLTWDTLTGKDAEERARNN